MIYNPPTLVEFTNAAGRAVRFLIFDAPTDGNSLKYLEFLKAYNVEHVVRTCSLTYSTTPFEDAGITIHDLQFKDGIAPPTAVLNRFRNICRKIFFAPTSDDLSKKPCIGLHCVAGLGRAPVLACIGLIDGGMSSLAAVELVRSKRRGALNANQFLKTYKPKFKAESMSSISMKKTEMTNANCCIM